MGDHVATSAVTGVEFRQFSHSVNRKFDEIVTLITMPPHPALPFKLPYEGTRVQHAPLAPSLPGVPTSTSYRMVRARASPPAVRDPILAQDLNKPDAATTYQLPEKEPHVSSLPRLPQVSIAALGREHGAWRRAIVQWEEVDPVTGLALKDWPSEWYRGDQRLKVGSLRSQRQIIFEEFER